MAKTIANVLVGVANLFVRQPNDSIAEWDTDHAQAGTHSVKLYKSGTGNAGSTHLELSGLTSLGLTLTAFCANPTNYGYYFYIPNAVVGNYIQYELYYKDPDSDAWAEVTIVTMQGHTPASPVAWVQETFVAATDPVGFGGHAEDGLSFFDWDLGTTISTLIADMITAGCTAPGDWILERVRCELWECSPERTVYVDSIQIAGVTYTIEPGGTGPGISLSSAFTEVGYTEDGVTIEYTADEADIEVEEETFPIDRVITKETLQITCNMAESSLANINNAMAGAVLSGTKLTLGEGVNKTMNLKIQGTNPGGYHREIFVPLATATGAVGMAYKKGEKTVVPVTFQALKGTSPACTIVDNIA